MTLRRIGFAAAAAAAIALPGVAQAYWGQATTSVNLRTCGGTSCPAITVIPAGSQVWVNGAAGSWYQVNFAGQTGFVAANYVATATAVPRVVSPRPQVTIGLGAGPRPRAPFGVVATPTWDNRYNAWYAGGRWYYDGAWYRQPPRAGVSFGFRIG